MRLTEVAEIVCRLSILLQPSNTAIVINSVVPRPVSHSVFPMPIILPPHCASLWFHNVAPTLKGTIALRMRQYLPRCPFRSAASTCRDALQHDDWFSQTPFVRPGHKAYILRVLPRTLLPSHVGENRCHICCNFVANVNWGSCSNFSALRKRPDLTARSLCHWT